MKDAIDFLDRIEGHGYGGMADYEVARTTVRDGAAEVERLMAALAVAKEEIEWWVSEHGCCAGREDHAMKVIEAAICGYEQSTPAVGMDWELSDETKAHLAEIDRHIKR